MKRTGARVSARAGARVKSLILQETHGRTGYAPHARVRARMHRGPRTPIYHAFFLTYARTTLPVRPCVMRNINDLTRALTRAFTRAFCHTHALSSGFNLKIA